MFSVTLDTSKHKYHIITLVEWKIQRIFKTIDTGQTQKLRNRVFLFAFGKKHIVFNNTSIVNWDVSLSLFFLFVYTPQTIETNESSTKDSSRDNKRKS